MAIESFSFDKGINRKKSPLLLDEGELYACSGFGFSHDGVLETRLAKQPLYGIDVAATSKINGIHRYGTDIYASSRRYCPGNQAFFNYIYHRLTTDTAWTITNKFLANNTRPRFADYEKFMFMVDGESKSKAYINEHGYDWGISNPPTGPVVSDSGVASAFTPNGPSGDYSCYVTFYVGFPNEKFVETGPSPVGTVTVVDKKITWSKIPTCGYSGDEISIHRRLYRTVSGVPFLVAEIPDNVTETYTDDVIDSTLQDAIVLETDGYNTPPLKPTDICAGYLHRVWLIWENRLGWSEVYSPFSFKTTSDIVVTKEDENLTGVIDWGDQLFVVSLERWYRLQGSDPNTWVIKRTFADAGIVNCCTLKKSIYGLIGLWNDGVYLFDGSLSRNITLKKLGSKFFTDLTDKSTCYAEFDGSKYYLYYASTGSTLDSCLVIDFTYGSDYRVFQEEFIPHAYELYRATNSRYFAYAGYEYTESSATQTIYTSILTGDRVFGAVMQRKNPKYLFYDINTNGKDVTVTILMDGTLCDSLTLNTSSRERKRSRMLKQVDGYRFSIAITCADSQGLEIYSPWALEATPVGD